MLTFLFEMDWHQLWEQISLPDNVPIVLLIFLMTFYCRMTWKNARANDKLIDALEKDPEMAKTHHRTTYPHHPKWDKTVSVWPYLLKIEFLAAIIVTAFMILWSVFLDAPLEEPANPSLTMNPSKAPWYFLGLQEMLVYFDPWIAGVVLPGIILGGLMAIPFLDVNPLGNGYYTWKQRKFAIGTFLFGFLGLWCSMVIIGTFMRGPGWMWFWPGETWDHLRVVHEVNRDLHDIFGIEGALAQALFGFAVIGVFCAVTAGLFHAFLKKCLPKALERMSIIQYAHLQFFMITMLALPVKMFLRLSFTVKYVLVTPWFNI